MKAVVFDENLKLVDNYETPMPKKGEVLIKTRMSGICNTDLEITKGYMGYKGVLGHEFVGDVVKVGDECDFKWMGKRVVGEINCGKDTAPTVKLWAFGKKTAVLANILPCLLKIYLKYPKV